MKRSLGRIPALITAFVLVLSLSAFCPEKVFKADAESGAVRIRINKTNFPDPVFRKLISGADYDLKQDGYIDSEDIFYARNIYCEGMGIKSLKGIEYFTELRGLWCKDNSITSIDISPFKELTGLWCSGNPLKKLDLTKNPELLWVYCYDCKLTKVDFSKNPKMAFIEINTNPLTELNVSANPELEHLTCGSCGLKKLDLRNNKKLAHLDAFMNKLTKLDLSNNTKLKRLDIWWNTGLGDVNVSMLKGLQYYNCAYNGLKKLDVSQNKELSKLICSYNQLEKLDLSGNPKLAILHCEDNPLKELDLTYNPKLRILKAALADFTELNIGNNPYLIKAYNEGVCQQEYLDETEPVGHSWTIDYGGEDSTGGEISTEKDNIYHLWLDDKVTLITQSDVEIPAEEYYSEPDPGVTESDMIKREQLVQILYEMAGSPDVSGLSSRFKDVKPDSKYYSALLWGEENGICLGYPDFTSDTFGAGKYITRQDLMLMLMRYTEYMGYERAIDFGRADDFLDCYEVDFDHWEAVTWAATWLILTGKGEEGAPKEERRIDPYGRATYAEAETMINRMLEINGIDDFISLTYKIGDVNNDGSVNVKDLTALQRWINGWPVVINEANSDVNDDGKINIKDLTALQKLINNRPAS